MRERRGRRGWSCAIWGLFFFHRPCDPPTHTPSTQVLKQKKMYEGQRDQLYNQQANMESTTFALQSVKDTADTVSAMRAAGTELKAAMKDKNLDVSSIEKLQDEVSWVDGVCGACVVCFSPPVSHTPPTHSTQMADLMDAQAEIQEVMGQTFGVPDELDEDELLGELDALEDELAAEAAGGSTVDAGGAPSYLTEEPTDLPAVPAGRVPVAEPAGRN